MKAAYFFLVLILIGPLAKSQSLHAETMDQLLERIQNGDTVYVVNFWATWCTPCIRELPEFEKLHETYLDKPVKVLMVSLDFKSDFPQKIELFLKRRRLALDVVWLNESKPNEFIPRIYKHWGGSIPATWIVYRPNKFTWFKEGMVEAKEMESQINAQFRE